jgi:lipoate-protein ligase A
LLYDVNVDEMFRYLTPDEDKLKDKQIQDFRERVTSISRGSEASFKQTKDAVRKHLLEGKSWKKSSWSENEIEKAEELANKYRSDKWLYRRQ